MWIFSRVGPVIKRLHVNFTGFVIKFYANEILAKTSSTYLPLVQTRITNYGTLTSPSKVKQACNASEYVIYI